MTGPCGVTDTLSDYMAQIGQSGRVATQTIALSSHEMRRQALQHIASHLTGTTDQILSANAVDLSQAVVKGLDAAMLDRLRLDETRVSAIAESVRTIAAQDDPLGRIIDEWSRPNGLTLRKVAVPIGVIGMIYESRPNVTVDAAALCLLSGNAVILRGGSEAINSNHALHRCVVSGLQGVGFPAETVQLLATQNRDAVGLMLGGLNGTVDLIIPRGGKGLVSRVQTDARVPVLAHLDGLNHTYVHKSANLDMAIRLIANAKMRRTGICGATETALIDRAVAAPLLPTLAEALVKQGCELRGDNVSQQISQKVGKATDTDFQTEHLAPILNIAIVDNVDAAIEHISTYGSGHTDAIIAEADDIVQRFLSEVDSAIVMHNASTQFADGGEFGFGAEIGIATGRLHARGPVGAQHLTTYKYHVLGQGTLRP